jgi:hypothetical protein
MTQLAVLLLTLAAPTADDAKKPVVPPAARVTITAELACLHCTYGQGDGCAVCLNLGEKTPVLLAGKAAKQFEDERLSNKVVVAEGTLSLNKDKRLVLTSDNAHVYTDKDKGKAPDKGLVRVAGNACCAKCNLELCDECTVAIKNAALPIVLDGKLAAQHAMEGKEPQPSTAVGKLFLDKKGLLRLDATKFEMNKK